MSKLESYREQLLEEISKAEKALKEPLPDTLDRKKIILENLRRIVLNDRVVRLRKLYDECFPDPKAVLGRLELHFTETRLY